MEGGHNTDGSANACTVELVHTQQRGERRILGDH